MSYAIYVHNLLAIRAPSLERAEQIVFARFLHCGAVIEKERESLALELRRGLEMIKEMYREHLRHGGFYEQWAGLVWCENGFDWTEYDRVEGSLAIEALPALKRLAHKGD